MSSNSNPLLDDTYWSQRYQENDDTWDIGYASPAISKYVDGLTNKEIKILIPGCGNSHEAAHLLDSGFKHITLVDISETLVLSLKEKFKHQSINIFHQNFFDHNDEYDLIIEQTFFCAINPVLRNAYAQKISSLLKTAGKLVGLFFNCNFEESPPFGGNIEEYKTIFTPFFNIKRMETCSNSIPRRQGKELFVVLEKLNNKV